MDHIVYFVKENSKAYQFLCDNLSDDIKKISFIEDVIDIPLHKGNTLYICNTYDNYLRLLSENKSVAFWECDLDNAERLPMGAFLNEKEFGKYIIQDIEELTVYDYRHIYNRLNKLPENILRTKRVLVRETTVEDVDSFLELYKDPSITLYMEDLFDAKTEKEYQENYIKNIYEFYDIGIWTLVLIESENEKKGQVIGRMGIEMTDEEGIAEMGFMLGIEFQGQGYATEVGKAILDYSRTVPGIKAVRARVHVENVASQKLCERLGMYKDTEENDMINYLWRINS